jgi:hypothetical protein
LRPVKFEVYEQVYEQQGLLQVQLLIYNHHFKVKYIKTLENNKNFKIAFLNLVKESNDDYLEKNWDEGLKIVKIKKGNLNALKDEEGETKAIFISAIPLGQLYDILFEV